MGQRIVRTKTLALGQRLSTKEARMDKTETLDTLWVIIVPNQLQALTIDCGTKASAIRYAQTFLRLEKPEVRSATAAEVQAYVGGTPGVARQQSAGQKFRKQVPVQKTEAPAEVEPEIGSKAWREAAT